MGPTPMLYYAEASMRTGGWRHSDNWQPQSRQLQWLQDGISAPAVFRRGHPGDRPAGGGRAIGSTAPARSRRARSSRTMSIACWSVSTASRTIGWPHFGSAGTPATAPPARRSKLLAARLPGEHFTLLHRGRRQLSQSSSRSHCPREPGGPSPACRGEEPRLRNRFRRRRRPDRRDRRRRPDHMGRPADDDLCGRTAR